LKMAMHLEDPERTGAVGDSPLQCGKRNIPVIDGQGARQLLRVPVEG